MTPPPPRALTLACGAPILHYGPSRGPQLVVLQPLFEEMNRCRALVSALCRGLAGAGVGCWLPDLPGTGEDRRDLGAVSWSTWRAAVSEAADLAASHAGAPPSSLAIRGGALLDAGFARRWRLSPVGGASLLRDLQRAGLTGEAMAGYDLGPDLRSALADTEPGGLGAVRTVRLAGDERPAEARIAGAALWRRAEPAADAALAASLIDDILAWSSAEKPATVVVPPVEELGTVVSGRCIAAIPLGESWIAATLDGPPDAPRGWLFVTGGSQTRVGPNRLYERLATMLADAGHAVIRFDRRGVGDSPGEDAGYLGQAEELEAAIAALRASFPAITGIAGFGLCDGATALALEGRGLGIDRLIIVNPWVVEPRKGEPPAAAVRAHYRDRVRDAAAWGRLLSGGVDLSELWSSLKRSRTPDPLDLATRFAAGVPEGSTILLADGDNTARAFADAWDRLADTPPVETIRIPTRSHSFAGREAQAALAAALIRRR